MVKVILLQILAAKVALVMLLLANIRSNCSSGICKLGSYVLATEPPNYAQAPRQEDVADELLLAGQEAQQIDDKHRAPDPLSSVVRPARNDPGILQRRSRRHDLLENALLHHAICELQQLWTAGLEERRPFQAQVC